MSCSISSIISSGDSNRVCSHTAMKVKRGRSHQLSKRCACGTRKSNTWYLKSFWPLQNQKQRAQVLVFASLHSACDGVMHQYRMILFYVFTIAWLWTSGTILQKPLVSPWWKHPIHVAIKCIFKTLLQGSSKESTGNIQESAKDFVSHQPTKFILLSRWLQTIKPATNSCHFSLQNCRLLAKNERPAFVVFHVKSRNIKW